MVASVPSIFCDPIGAELSIRDSCVVCMIPLNEKHITAPYRENAQYAIRGFINRLALQAHLDRGK